jgi:hypothetical protein|tara:strand:- start:647 stop:1855 length:1209 start_codon:yes stop_codon:yes gene_type:complete
MSQEEQVIEQVVDETVEAKPEAVEQPKEEKVSYKEITDDGTIKLNLAKLDEFQKQQEQQPEQEKQEVVEEQQETVVEEKTEVAEQPVLEEVKEEEQEKQQEVETQVEQQVQPEEKVDEVKQEVTEQPQVKLPENIESLVSFMEETGGSLEDYVRINADYSNVDNDTLLREYYKSTRPHLNFDEINFLIDDQFKYEEDVDEERDIRKKKLALKEEIAKAKGFLTKMKDQYYKEVKLTSKLDPKQQEAISFYDKYNQQQTETAKIQKQQQDHFLNVTDNVFNDNFKGFDFNVGDKKYRYNIKDVSGVKEYQSNIANFVNEFVDDNNLLNDAAGYHKALYAAKNIDKIVSHFYEQGKADAIKETTANAKNIDMSPRTSPVVEANGVKFRVLNGEDSSRLKFKIRK